MIFKGKLSKFLKQKYSNLDKLLTPRLIIENSGPKWCNQKLADDHLQLESNQFYSSLKSTSIRWNKQEPHF